MKLTPEQAKEICDALNAAWHNLLECGQLMTNQKLARSNNTYIPTPTPEGISKTDAIRRQVGKAIGTLQYKVDTYRDRRKKK